MSAFYILVLILGYAIIALSLFYSFKEFNVSAKGKPFHLKVLFIVPLSSFLLTNYAVYFTVSYYLKNLDGHNYYVEPVLMLINFFIWSLFFLLYFKSKHEHLIFFKICLFLFLGGLSFVFFYFQTNYEYLTIIAIQNVIICIYCMCYISEQILYNPELNFKHQPESWIIGGVFLYSAVSTPFFVSFGFVKYAEMHVIYEIILPITNLLIIFMHCMIIKSTFVARRNRLGPSLKELEKKRLAEQDEERRRKNAERFGFRVNRT